MFERVFRSIVMMLAIGWMMAPRFLSAQITPELIEAAKKEGEVMFYGAITINSSKAIGDASRKIRHQAQTLARRCDGIDQPFARGSAGGEAGFRRDLGK